MIFALCLVEGGVSPIMKKAKLSLALVAGLVATIGLSSCDEVTKAGSTVLTFNDAQGTEISLTAEEMFEDYKKTSYFDCFKQALDNFRI